MHIYNSIHCVLFSLSVGGEKNPHRLRERLISFSLLTNLISLSLFPLLKSHVHSITFYFIFLEQMGIQNYICCNPLFTTIEVYPTMKKHRNVKSVQLLYFK